MLTYFPIILLIIPWLILLPVHLLSWKRWLLAKPLFCGAGTHCLCQGAAGSPVALPEWVSMREPGMGRSVTHLGFCTVTLRHLDGLPNSTGEAGRLPV